MNKLEILIIVRFFNIEGTYNFDSIFNLLNKINNRISKIKRFFIYNSNDFKNNNRQQISFEFSYETDNEREYDSISSIIKESIPDASIKVITEQID